MLIETTVRFIVIIPKFLYEMLYCIKITMQLLPLLDVQYSDLLKQCKIHTRELKTIATVQRRVKIQNEVRNLHNSQTRNKAKLSANVLEYDDPKMYGPEILALW